MTDPVSLPPLPPIDASQQIPYESIRYLAGFHESYIHKYAQAYAREAVMADRERVIGLVRQADYAFPELLAAIRSPKE